MLMTRVFLTIAAFFCLASCAREQFPQFARSNSWHLQGNEVMNRANGMKIDFGGGNTFPLSNMSDGDYDLHFVCGESDFKSYPPVCSRYIIDVMRNIPLKTDSVELILADRFMVLSLNADNRWRPDYTRLPDGSWLAVEANPVTSVIQPHDELWRNVVFSNGKKRIVVVDRMVYGGHHYAIVYVMQSEKKGLPFANVIHYDVTNRQNIQMVGSYMDWLLGISEKAIAR